MTVSALCTEESVRELLRLSPAGTSDFPSQLLNSNIRSASQFLERATRRILRDEPTLTLKFTTEGAARVVLPGLRTGTGVTINGGSLTVDEGYHLIPDANQTGLYTAIQFRPYSSYPTGNTWFLHNPMWFEYNLDRYPWQGGGWPSFPNDLVIAGAWGFEEDDLPEIVRDTTKILAAFKTLRPDAFLSGAKVTESGIFDLSKFPIEVQAFISDWRLGTQAVGIG